MGTRSVKMPDGQVIDNVPDNITQDDLLRQYAEHKIATKQSLSFKEGLAKLMGDTREAVKTGQAVQTPLQKDISTALPNFLTHVASPFAGAAEFAGTAKPSQVLQGVQDIIDESAGPVTKTAGFAGDIYGGGKALNLLGKVGKVAPAAAKGFKNLAPWEQAVLSGGAFGAMMPTGKTYGDEGFGSDKLLGTASGSLFGLGAHGAATGLANLAAPQLARLAQLEAQGIPRAEAIKQLTFGQLVGGPAQWLENKVFSSIPFGGTKGNIERGKTFIQNQQKEINVAKANQLAEEKLALKEQKARDLAALPKGSDQEAVTAITEKYDAQKKLLEAKHAQEIAELEGKHGDFSTPMIQKAVDPLGIKIPEGKSGHKAIEFAQSEIDKAYADHLKDLGPVFGNSEVLTRIQNIVDKASEGFGGLSEDAAKKLATEVQKNIFQPLEGGAISAEKWHTNYKDLGRRAYNLGKPGNSASEQELGQIYKQIQKEWELLGETSDNTGKLKEINSAYKSLQPVQRAAAGVEASLEGGEFTPKQLLTASKAESSTKLSGAGEAPYQQESIEAFNKMKVEKEAMEARHQAEKDAIDAMRNLEKEQHRVKTAANAEQGAEERISLGTKYDKEKLALDEAERIRKEQLGELVQEVVPQTGDKYVQNRLGYGLVASPWVLAATRGIGSEGASLANAAQNVVSGAAPSLAYSAAIPIAERLYSNPATQFGLKAVATGSRHPKVRGFGEKLRDIIESGDTRIPVAGGAYGNLPSSQEDVQDTAAGGLNYLTGPQIPE